MVTRNWLEALPADTVLLADGRGQLDAAALRLRVRQACDALLARRAPHAPVALLADNSPDW